MRALSSLKGHEQGTGEPEIGRETTIAEVHRTTGAGNRHKRVLVCHGGFETLSRKKGKSFPGSEERKRSPRDLHSAVEGPV